VRADRDSGVEAAAQTRAAPRRMSTPPSGWRDRVSRLIRDHSGHVLSPLARSLHTLSIHATGFGTAQLPVGLSGERRVLELLGHVRAPTIFDVGAFRGDYAAMARGVLPRAVIHCFEPGQTGLPRLHRLAQEADLHVHELALAGAAGQATLHSDPDTPTMASLHPGALAGVGATATRHQPVEATTIDLFCEEHAIRYVDLLKIDTEGTEIDVLRGAARMIAARAVGIIQFEFGYGDVATRTFLRDFYDILERSHTLHRIAPRGLIALGEYDLALEVFVGATNYAALPRREVGHTADGAIRVV
jgi:FkbM family methyltransferase